MPWTWDVVAHRSLLIASGLAWAWLGWRRWMQRSEAEAIGTEAIGAPAESREPAMTGGAAPPWGLVDVGLAAFVWIATLALGQAGLARAIGVKPGTPLVDLPVLLLAPWLWGSGLLLFCATFSGLAAASWRCGARWADWWGEARATRDAAGSDGRWRTVTRGIGEVARDVRDGLAAFLLLAGPVLALQELLTRWFPSRHPLVESLLSHPRTDVLVAVGFSALCIAPIVEELQFRVLLQGWLSRIATESAATASVPSTSVLPSTLRGKALAHGPTAASATLFALAHFSHGPDPLPLFVFALGLGELYRRTRRLLPVIVTHVALNAWSMMLLAASIGRGGA